MEKYIIFTLPTIFIKQLGLEECEPFMHKYIVTERGRLMVPWYDLMEKSDLDDFTYTIVHGIEYFDADDLMNHGSDEQKDFMRDLLHTLSELHSTRFDSTQQSAKS